MKLILQLFVFLLIYGVSSNESHGQSTSCDGTIYFSAINDGQGTASLYTIDPNTYEVNLLAELNKIINGIGFNPIDNHIYGFRGGKLIKINLEGTVVATLPIAGFEGGSFWAAAFSPQGEYILSGSGDHILRIVIANGTATVVGKHTKYYFNHSTTKIPKFGDIVFDPLNGLCYGMDISTQHLVTIDPYTGGVSLVGETNGISNYFGAMFSKVDGGLYPFLLNELYRVDQENGALTFLSNGLGTTGGIDACSCPFYLDLLHSFPEEEVCAGDTISLIFQFINGAVDEMSNLRFLNTLPAPLVFVGEPSNLFGGQIVNNSGNGFQHLLIEQMSIPKGISTFHIKAYVPQTIEESTILFNQASMDGFAFPLSPIVFSDEERTELIDDPTRLTIYPLPVITDFSFPLPTFCSGDTLALSAKANVEGMYHWKGPDSFNSDMANPIVYPITPSFAGHYQLQFESNKGCIVDTVGTLEVHPRAYLDLGKDSSICLLEPYVLRVPPFLSYRWQDGSADSYFSVDHYGFYSVEVLDENACTIRDSIHLQAGCPAELYIPNAFSPNGDGINDIFYTYGHDIRSFHLQIFDRWGEMVFESLDFGTGWDGTFHGQKMQVGVYLYQIVVSFENKEKRMFSGDLSLLR